jgi:hypothetical protein
MLNSFHKLFKNKHNIPVTDLIRFGDRKLIDKIEEEIS